MDGGGIFAGLFFGAYLIGVAIYRWAEAKWDAQDQKSEEDGNTES